MRTEWYTGQRDRSAELVEELGDKRKLACGAAESIVRSDGTDVCTSPCIAGPGMLRVFGGGGGVWRCASVCGGAAVLQCVPVRRCVCGSVCVGESCHRSVRVS